MKHDILTEKEALYLQLYRRLCREIAEGVYRYGEKFPSKRVIADRYGISLITVEHSLSLLLDEGYLEARERSGYFVSFRESDGFFAQSHEKKTYVRENPTHAVKAATFPFASYAKTARWVLSEYGEKIYERVPHAGALPLRQAISDYLKRSRGIYASPDQIYIGAGSEFFYGLLVQLFGRDKTFGIENPSYEKIEQVYRTQGVGLELLDLSCDGIETKVLMNSGAQVLHITPFRSYPTGISTSASKRREYIRWANLRSAWIIEDDFESEFTPSTKAEETVFSLSEAGNVLYLNSFSMTIAPAIRISYLVLPEKLVSVYEEKLGFYSCTVPAFEQYLLAELIMSGEFERHINRVRRSRRKAEKPIIGKTLTDKHFYSRMLW